MIFYMLYILEENVRGSTKKNYFKKKIEVNIEENIRGFNRENNRG